MANGRKNGICTVTALFISVCIFLGAVFAGNVSADDEEDYFPTLYCNDEVWYKADIYPLDLYFRTYYVPVSMFARFGGVSITYNERFGTLLISSVKTKTRFISFNINTDLALTNELDEFYAMIYTKGDERYVPLDVVCEALGLSFEYYRSERRGTVAVRICDGNQKRSFPELIALFAPSEAGNVTTVPVPGTTEPPVVDPPTPTGAKTIYITFDNIDTDSVDKVLAVLKEYRARATFFLNSDEVRRGGDHVIKIAAAGHSVGLAFDVSGYEADIEQAFNVQNDTLMRLIKHESRFVRIYGKDETASELKRAEKLEYVVWGWDISFASDEDDMADSLAALDRALKEKDVLTLRFSGREGCAETLGKVLGFIEQKTHFKTQTVNDATHTFDKE